MASFAFSWSLSPRSARDVQLFLLSSAQVAFMAEPLLQDVSTQDGVAGTVSPCHTKYHEPHAIFLMCVALFRCIGNRRSGPTSGNLNSGEQS